MGSLGSYFTGGEGRGGWLVFFPVTLSFTFFPNIRFVPWIFYIECSVLVLQC